MEERVLSLPQKTRLIKSLPSAIRSCVEDGGWQIVMPRNTSSCTIMTEEEFVNKYARNGFCQTNKEIESNMSSHLNRFGLDHDDPNTFMSLLNPEVAEKLREHLSEQLVKDGKQPVRTIAELYEVIATFLIRSRFRLSTPVAYKQFLLPLEKSENITLTSQSRFVDIIPRIRGYDVSGRSGDDTLEDTWMQDKNRLRNLEELEEKMFAPSIKLIMNKRSGELVLDDELIGSRSNDVECKTKRRKLEVFSEHPTLTRLRKFSSSSYQHMKVNINDVDPTKNRKKCALCAKGNMKYRQTSFMCNLCEVPLCARQYGKRKNNESCFQLWHNSENLMDVHKQAHDSIIRAKASDDDKLGDDNDESSTYSVDDSDIQQVPALPRIEGNIDSQEVPELPMIEGDIVTQQASELTRIEGV